MQPIDGLSEQAKIAYQAFHDMSDSKTAHFDSLKQVENIYESGGVPSAAETLELQKLLANHDKSVLAFKAAMAAVIDNDEKKTLLQLMT